MGLSKLFILALATGASASAFYGTPPAPSSGQGNVVVTTTVVTVTSFARGPATEVSLHSEPEVVVTSAPTVIIPPSERPLPSAGTSKWVDLSSWEPPRPGNNTDITSATTVSAFPPGTYTATATDGFNTTFVVSGTANATSFYHTGTPTGSAVATKTTGPDSGIGKVKVGVAVGLAAIAVAILGA